MLRFHQITRYIAQTTETESENAAHHAMPTLMPEDTRNMQEPLGNPYQNPESTQSAQSAAGLGTDPFSPVTPVSVGGQGQSAPTNQSVQTYQLPFLAKVSRLAPIPGDPTNSRYGIVMRLKDVSQPQNGLGYIVRFADDPATGKQNNKQVQIIAWISKSLKVYPTTVPLTNDPSTNDVEGELHFDAWTDQKNLGAVRIQSNDGLNRTITIGELQLDFSGSGYSTGSLNGIATASSVDLGPYGPAATNSAAPAHATNTGSARHPLNSLLAAFWLAAAHFPKLRGEQLGMGAGRIVEIFQNMQNKPLADALDEIIWRGTTNSNTASPFERFAARQLIEAGAGQIREITAEHNLDVVQLDSTGQFWMRFNRNEITGLQRDIVLSVEGALNRLAAASRIAAKYDNGMGLVTTLTEAQDYRAGFDELHEWDTHTSFIQSRADARNSNLTVRGATAARGGMWDVMSRFVDICERLILPYRVEYRCDANPDTGEMVVNFTVPTSLMMPASVLTDSGWVGIREQRAAQAASYALRLAGIIAQAAFTAGTNITSLTVNGTLGSVTGAPVLSLAFTRTPFMMGTVPAFMAGQFNDPALDSDPAAVLQMLRPSAQVISFGPDRGLTPITALPIPQAILAHRVPLWRDDRELPDDLKALLGADFGRDLDVMYDGASIKGGEIFQIAEQNEDSPMSASLEIESALMGLQSEMPDLGERKPLYCEHPLMRLLVANLPDHTPQTRYVKAPDALYNSHIALARIHRDSGDLDGSLAQLQQALALAPTTAQPFVDESITYVDIAGDHAKGADVLTRGLAVAVMPGDVNFMYYRLAYSLWQTNNREAALACYAFRLGMGFHAQYEEAAEVEVRELMQEMGVDSLPDMDAVTHTLNKHGIPVAPLTSQTELLAKAAIRLVDAGFPLAADEAVWALGALSNDDRLGALRQSLRFGVLDEDAVLASERPAN